MLTDLDGSKLTELYHVALSCCGKNLKEANYFQPHYSTQVTQQRMKIIIGLAMKDSAYFRSYANILMGK